MAAGAFEQYIQELVVSYYVPEYPELRDSLFLRLPKPQWGFGVTHLDHDTGDEAPYRECIDPPRTEYYAPYDPKRPFTLADVYWDEP